MQWPARQEFNNRSGGLIGWGLALLAVASGLLIWLGYLLLAPYTVDSPYSSGTMDCESPIADPYFQKDRSPCGPERDWPGLMLILASSVPPAVAGTALCVTGSTRRQVSAHVFSIIEMQKVEERRQKKQDEQNKQNKQNGQGSPS
ncbi:hypothetical protein [Streptomyces sp. NPDC052042]|uniref:hypothetical protein n=1 Tax=Streptomyces sp. NPDC052042 TaxID=3365683 RepID=UPI0037CEDDA4